MSKEEVIDTIADLRMQLMYLEDHADELNESESAELKTTRGRIASLCNTFYWREKKNRRNKQ